LLTKKEKPTKQSEKRIEEDVDRRNNFDLLDESVQFTALFNYILIKQESGFNNK